MSSNGLTLDLITLTEVFKIQDVLQYNINVYHSLLFNTILDTDDRHGGVGLYINETFTSNVKISQYSFLMYSNLYF